MPRTMQHSMVSTRPTMVALPASWTMALMRMEARPVTVIQPAMMPAMLQATATVIAPREPASRDSTAEKTERLPALPSALPVVMGWVSPSPRLPCRKKLTKPTAMAARME